MTVTSSTEDISKTSHETDEEIPVWIHGEQRWISGITSDTTCAQLVDALLREEGIAGEPAPSVTVTATTAAASTTATATAGIENQYVITERWRRVEQVLDNKTKILKIWRAWGETKSEVCVSYVHHRRVQTLQIKLEDRFFLLHFAQFVCVTFFLGNEFTRSRREKSKLSVLSSYRNESITFY